MNKKDKDRILAEPFRIFPDPPAGKPYGPNEKQKPLFINRFSLDTRRKEYHTHTQDVVLAIGGARGGKTIGAVAVVIDTLLRYPGSQALIGAKTFQDLQDTVMEEWRKRFTVKKNWDHPLIDARPTNHSKIVRLVNGSFARFMHFEDFERLRGREADIVHLDEASQMPDARAFQELIRRSSGNRVPIRQFILTTNPPEQHNWLHDIFKLEQYKPGYDGPRLQKGELCTCHMCQRCLGADKEVFWEERPTMDSDGRLDTVYVCPECGNVKMNTCDGNQEFFRVIQSSALDNHTLPDDYLQTVKSSMDPATYALYGLGALIELRQGKVYKSYSHSNVIPPRPGQVNSKDVDIDKPLHWTFDFNISYQCSAIIQTINTAQGVVAEVLGEIVLPEAGPEAVARAFVAKYPKWSKLNNPNAQPVLLYGDPTGLNRSSDGNERSKFQIVFDILQKEGFDVRMMVKKMKGKTLIPVMHRVDAVNTMLMDANGLRRLFIDNSCVYSKISLEGVKYKEKVDPPVIDKQCDDNAARNPDKRSPCLLTHISDAIGYFVIQAAPIINENGPPPFIDVVGEGRITATDKGLVEKIFPTAKEPPRERSLREELNNIDEGFGGFGGFNRFPGFFW